jgi:hypothetical protein
VVDQRCVGVHVQSDAVVGECCEIE